MSNGDIGFWTGSIVYVPNWNPAGFTLNIGATDANGVDWLWMSIQGWDSPPVIGSVVQRASDHGGWPTEQYFTPRPLTLTLHASCPTQAARDAARATLQQILPVNDLATLTYNEPVPKQMQFRRSSQITEVYSTLTDVEFTCVLIAPDPRKYSTLLKNLTAVMQADPTHTGLKVPFILNTNLTPPVQIGTASATSTTVTLTATSAVPVGSTVMVGMGAGNATAQTVTAADTKGNKYTLVNTAQNATAAATSCFALTAPITVALTTSDTITVTTTNSQTMVMTAWNVPYAVTLDNTNLATGNSTAPAVSTLTANSAVSYSFALFANNTTKVAGTPSTWTAGTNVVSGSVELGSFFKANTATTPITATSSYGASAPWAAIAVVMDVATSSTLPPQQPGGSVNVTNAGNFETRPIITIQGPISGPYVIDTQTGHFISFSYVTLGVGDRLVIDTDERIGTLNGSYRSADINSWWWMLQPGTHTLLLAGSTTGGASMTISYRDAYI